MTHIISLVAIVIYVPGFVAMYFYSLKRDVACGLPGNPREAICVAIFWPILFVIMIIAIFIEKVAGLARAGYRRCKRSGKS
ncbi:TPA: hypothetical protein SH488_000080 [Salmonella enterica]|nr:hypothetical protein [Salmonella enterica subsp. enterica serovar Uganda]HEH9008918.1 hypothetical protein [Salmonella enterica]